MIILNMAAKRQIYQKRYVGCHAYAIIVKNVGTKCKKNGAK